MDPAAGADLLNADVRPDRRSAAAASDDNGRGVDHGRGYKAAPGFRQPVPPSFRDGPKDQTRNPEVVSARFRVRARAPRNDSACQIVGFHGAGITR